MKLLPSPPTDNLYKYAAITGLWLSLGFSLIFALFIKTSYSIEDYDLTSTWITIEETQIQKDRNRISSLESGKINENKINGISDSFTPNQEILFLKNSIILEQKRIKQDKDNLKEIGNHRETWKWFQRSYINIWIPIAIPLSILLSYFGFRLWHKKTQKYADEILILERDIKMETLKQMQKSKWKINTNK